MTDSRLYAYVGHRVAERRNELRLTQADVARRIGLTRASLANIESGRQKVMLHHLYSLVEALELGSVTDLLPERLLPPEADDALLFHGTDVNESEKTQLKQMVDRALLRVSRPLRFNDG